MTLTERLQQAEAGSRELSDEFLLAMGWRKTTPEEHPEEHWIDPTDDVIAWHWQDRPDPTQDLNDVLAMVPEGLYARLWIGERPEHMADEPVATLWSKDVRAKESVYGVSANGATPALALCIALLQAKGADNE